MFHSFHLDNITNDISRKLNVEKISSVKQATPKISGTQGAPPPEGVPKHIPTVAHEKSLWRQLPNWCYTLKVKVSLSNHQHIAVPSK